MDKTKIINMCSIVPRKTYIRYSNTPFHPDINAIKKSKRSTIKHTVETIILSNKTEKICKNCPASKTVYTDDPTPRGGYDCLLLPDDVAKKHDILTEQDLYRIAVELNKQYKNKVHPTDKGFFTINTKKISQNKNVW